MREKYDGWRCLAYKRGGLVRLLSRNGIDYIGRFRALAAAIALLPASTLLLDGEVTAFDEHLLSRRAVLHPDPHALVTPPIYIAFDCVHARGRDLREHPLGARRDVLERLIDDQHLLFPARRLPAHGLAAWAEVQRRGYEGLVAKDESSAYRSGRTRAWLKVKLRDEERVPTGCDRAETSDRGRPGSTPLPSSSTARAALRAEAPSPR